MIDADRDDSIEHSNSDAGEVVTSESPEESKADEKPKEIGGRDGPDPTRYGDWEKAGRCIDF